MKKKSKIVCLGFLLVMIAFFACGNRNLKPVLSQSSDSYTIVILNEKGSIKSGSGKFYLEFRTIKDNQLTDVGNVEVSSEMPMPGMPMVNQAEVKATNTPGRYEVKYNFEMSGSWNLTIKYNTNKTAVISLSIS